ncbi:MULTISPECIES: hypothetical protein [unclassified Streptomyces]|uniref:hypothetical protein n=1 Tax=unclassified Streptomyces TaxID=2593676 RepID=UPI001F2A9C01|nr:MULTISPECIES: hypothetical protein [unclassified Streptomyces]
MSAHRLPATALLGAFAVTAAVAWAAAGRRRGAPAIAGALLTLQGALHTAFSTTGAHGPTPGAHHAAHGTHGAAGPVAGTEGAGSALDPAVAQLVDSATASGPGMLAVHLLAALLCGLWLAHGEAAFFTLARAALAHAFTPLRLLRALVRVPDAPRGPVRRTRRTAHRPHTVVLAHTLSRRGPPRPSTPRATALGAHV